MEAKDTVMTPEQIQPIVGAVPIRSDNFGITTQSMLAREKALIEAQAEISFKTGIKEVVGWVLNNSQWLPGRTAAYFQKSEWQAKLRKWGL